MANFRFQNTPSQDNTGRVATYLQQEIVLNGESSVLVSPTAFDNTILIGGIDGTLTINTNVVVMGGDRLTFIFGNSGIVTFGTGFFGIAPIDVVDGSSISFVGHKGSWFLCPKFVID